MARFLNFKRRGCYGLRRLATLQWKVMIFKVKRLHHATESGRRYHIVDEAHHLLLVADRGSPWLADVPPRRVRFALPNGELVASLDLPQGSEGPAGKPLSYAVIFNHAVYMIINRLIPKDGRLPDYVLEVEGYRWLAARQGEGNSAALNIYDQLPGDAVLYVEDELPEPIGSIQTAEGEYDFTISLPGESLSQAALVALALITIIEVRSVR
jgi:hypothetical protein